MSLVQTERGIELTHLRKGAVGRGLAPAEASFLSEKVSAKQTDEVVAERKPLPLGEVSPQATERANEPWRRSGLELRF